MITGQKPIKKSKQGRFQILDVVDMMRPITKYTHQLASADNIPARTREAFRLAQEEKPGATHLELPEDIAHDPTDAVPFKPSYARRPLADGKSILAAVRAIEAAKSPILVIGAGANRTMTGKMLLELIEKTGIPFLTTQLGKGVIDERHPQFLGCAALSAGDFVHAAIRRADVIVNVGHDVIEKPPFFMSGDDTTVIHMSFRSAEVDPVYFPQIEVIGDIANAVWQLKEAIMVQPHWDFVAMHTARAAEVAHRDAAVDEQERSARIGQDAREHVVVDGAAGLAAGGVATRPAFGPRRRLRHGRRLPDGDGVAAPGADVAGTAIRMQPRLGATSEVLLHISRVNERAELFGWLMKKCS
jgi:acetolactate synthase-1/2/3 large subunit